MKRSIGMRLSLFTKLVVLITAFSVIPLLCAIGIFIWKDPSALWQGILAMVSISSFTLTGAFIFARHLTRPMRALMRSAERIAQGDFSTIVQVNTRDELQDVANAFNRMSEDMRRFSEVRVDEIVAEKAKTEGIIYSSEDGIVLTDQEGHVQLINPKAKSILELAEETREVFSGRPIWSFVKDDRLAVALRETIEGDTPKQSR